MADYVEDIINAIPVPIRQLGAGVATIPSEALRFGALVANPMRAYRQLTGEATPDDLSRTGGVAQVLQGTGDAWNRVVNDALNVSDPSVLDDTGNALARFAGNALPRLPVAAGQAAIGALPTAGRAAARLLEVVTPVTVTSRTGAASIAPRVANTVVPATAAGVVEKATETVDPTQIERVYDAEGNLQETIYPATEGGLGRSIANPVANAISESPGAVAAGAVGLTGLALLARRANRASQEVREATATSDVLKPNDPTVVQDVAVPGTGRTSAAVEVLADQNLTAKQAVTQALPKDAPRAAQINSMIDLSTEQAHKSRVTAMRDQGIIETPEGRIDTIPINRTAEELTLASRNDPTLRRDVDERIELENALDERLMHERAVGILRQQGKTDDEIARTTNHMVAVDSQRPVLDSNGQQLIVDSKPQWEQDYIISRPSQWNLTNQEIRDRLNTLRNGRTDPWFQKYRRYHDDALQAVLKYKALGPDEVAKMIGKPGVTTGANPNYRHTTNIGENKSPFTTRLRGHHEGPEYGGDPWNAAREYSDHVMDHSFRNMRTREMMDALLDARDAGMDVGKLIVDHADPRRLRRQAMVTTGQLARPKTKADVKLTGDIIRYRDGNDIVEVQVANKALYNTVTSMPHHAQTVMGTIKGWAESGMTGKIATLMGQPFALANATMGAIYGMVTRPKSLPLGVLDRTVMSATGGRFGVRGDPTAYVGMAAQAGKNVSVVMARAFSDSLKNSIAANGTLSKIIPNADALADRLGDVWRESMYARQFRTGAGDVNTLGGQGVDVTARSSMIEGMEHTEQARVVNPASKGDFRRYMDVYGKNATPASVKAAWRVLGEVQQAIANAPQSYAYATNLPRRIRNMTEGEAFREVQTLSAEVRQLLGDPSMRGTGLRDFQDVPAYTARGAVGRVLDATPYANIGVQATARMVRAFKEDFVGTTAGVAMTLGPVVILPILHAYDLDKERMARGEPPIYIPYELGREHYHGARMIKVHVDGVAPHDAPEYRNDPLLAMVVAPLRELVLWMMGFAGNKQFEPNTPVDATVEGIREYALGRTRANIVNAAINATPISQLPPVLAGGMAALGVQAPNVAELVGRGGARMINERGLAGYDMATLQGASISKRTAAVFAAFFPGTAATLGAMLTAGEQAERRQPGTGAGTALGEMAGRSRDRLGEFNGILWDTQARRRATNDAAADMVNAREATFRAVEANYRSVKYPGTVGSGDYRQQAGEGGGVQGVSDPRMADLLSLVHRAWGKLQPLTGERTLAREQLLNIKQKGIPDFVERRRQENEQAERIVQINHRLLSQYQRLEHELSMYTGYRVRLDKLDPSKPITQFQPIR